MPPRKRSRTAAASTNSSSTAVVLGGGHAHPPRTVAKFRSGALCDVELQAADGTAFRAHAVCLTAGSEYMEALYSAKTEWKDADGPVKLEQVPAAALSVCLDFVYCGEATVEADQLSAVLEAAAYLQIEPLRDAAAEELQRCLGPATAFSTWALAESQGLAELATAAKATAARHFGDIAASEAWLSAPAYVVQALLSSDKLTVRSEADVYTAALAWLRARAPPLGAEEAAALLSHVRFPLLGSDFMRDTVNKEPLLETVAGMRMISEAFVAFGYGHASRRRFGFEQWIYAVGGEGSNGEALNLVERMDSAAA